MDDNVKNFPGGKMEIKAEICVSGRICRLGSLYPCITNCQFYHQIAQSCKLEIYLNGEMENQRIHHQMLEKFEKLLPLVLAKIEQDILGINKDTIN